MTAVVAQPPRAEQAPAVQGLPKRTDLPTDFRPVGELAGRGQFYAARGMASRRDDGGEHYTGSATTKAWAALAAKGSKGHGSQGVLYRVDGGAITAAGYLIRQSDLVSGKSFRGLNLRGLPFPQPAR
jgi:hypothetical protein